MTCKWLVTMVIVSPLSRVNRVVNGFTPITNHLLSGVILQVPSRKLTWLAGNHHFFFMRYIFTCEFFHCHIGFLGCTIKNGETRKPTFSKDGASWTSWVGYSYNIKIANEISMLNLW